MPSKRRPKKKLKPRRKRQRREGSHDLAIGNFHPTLIAISLSLGPHHLLNITHITMNLVKTILVIYLVQER